VGRSATAPVEAWIGERAASFNSPVHVHFDELFDGYSRAAGVELAHDVIAAAVRALGPQLPDVKPVVSLPLRSTRRFTRRPPEFRALPSLLDDFEPPSLTLVHRDAYGRVAMLMQNHQVALRIDRETPSGVIIWSYRTWPASDDEEWLRSISAEHWLKVSPGQELPSHR